MTKPLLEKIKVRRIDDYRTKLGGPHEIECLVALRFGIAGSSTVQNIQNNDVRAKRQGFLLSRVEVRYLAFIPLGVSIEMNNYGLTLFSSSSMNSTRSISIFLSVISSAGYRN